MTFSNDHTVHTSSRRLFLKYSLAGAFALGTVPLLGSAGAVSAASAAGGSNILIAYFSRSGNTRTIAEMIQQRTGGDLVQIQTVKPYPDSYEDCVEMARQEQRANAKSDHGSDGAAARDHPVTNLKHPAGADDGAEADGEEVPQRQSFFHSALVGRRCLGRICHVEFLLLQGLCVCPPLAKDETFTLFASFFCYI